jgi:hypothetical protein
VGHGLAPIAICDGRAGWVYYEKDNVYAKLAADDVTEARCTPATLREQLPRAGAFPHVINGYDSLESCRSTVAIYSRPDFNSGGLHVGPSPFPRAADFETALRQIGYSREYVRTRVAQPTPDDYWTFLLNLTLNGSPQDRHEFLRRVMSLQ